MYLQHMLLKIRETVFEIYANQISCPLSVPLLNIPNCKSESKYLSVCYISKLVFMNYLFANLVVALEVMCLHKNMLSRFHRFF